MKMIEEQEMVVEEQKAKAAITKEKAFEQMLDDKLAKSVRKGWFELSLQEQEMVGYQKGILTALKVINGEKV